MSYPKTNSLFSLSLLSHITSVFPMRGNKQKIYKYKFKHPMLAHVTIIPQRKNTFPNHGKITFDEGNHPDVETAPWHPHIYIYIF